MHDDRQQRMNGDLHPPANTHGVQPWLTLEAGVQSFRCRPTAENRLPFSSLGSLGERLLVRSVRVNDGLGMILPPNLAPQPSVRVCRVANHVVRLEKAVDVGAEPTARLGAAVGVGVADNDRRRDGIGAVLEPGDAVAEGGEAEAEDGRRGRGVDELVEAALLEALVEADVAGGSGT